MKPGARWRDTDIPWFVALLGAPAGGNAVSRLRSQYALVDKSRDPTATVGWFENDELGISVAFRRGRKYRELSGGPVVTSGNTGRLAARSPFWVAQGRKR